MKFANFLRTASGNNEQQQLLINSSSYVRVLPIVATKQFHQFFCQELINDFAVCKQFSGTLHVEDVISSLDFGNQNHIFLKGATLFNRSTYQNIPHFQVRLHKVYFLTNQVTSLIYTEKFGNLQVILRNRNRFYLNSRSYSEINRVYSNKWVLYQPLH